MFDEQIKGVMLRKIFDLEWKNTLIDKINVCGNLIARRLHSLMFINRSEHKEYQPDVSICNC